MAQLNITDFGAVGNGTTNNQTAIQNCLNQAAAGHSVFIPAGTFNHSGVLVSPGGVTAILGVGDASLLKATNYGTEVLRVDGSNIRLHNFQIRGSNGPRGGGNNNHSLWLNDINNFEIDHLTIRLNSGGGMFHQNCHNGHIHDNLIENTRADSIHLTHGSSDVLIENNTVRFSGDDGIACVSYGIASPQVHHVTARNNVVEFNTWGRGMSVIGGNNILYHNNIIRGGVTDKAGVYIAAESQYDTSGVNIVCVANNTIEDCGSTGSTGHGSVFIYNSQPGAIVQAVRIANNSIINSRQAAIRTFGSQPIHMNYYGNTHVGSSFPFLFQHNTNGASTFSTTPVASCPGTLGFRQYLARGANQLIA